MNKIKKLEYKRVKLENTRQKIENTRQKILKVQTKNRRRQISLHCRSTVLLSKMTKIKADL